MSLTTRQGTPVTWYSKVLITIILFSLVVIPLCAAEGNETVAEEGNDTAAQEGNDTAAQEENYSIDPTILTISAVEGDTVTSTFLIKNNNPETTLEYLQIVPLPLTRADNQEVIPADAITQGTIVLMEPPNGLTIPVTFNFTTSVPGEYTGKLVINSNSSITQIPVQVKLKAEPWIPALVLIIFTVFSVVFYDYATRGVRRDRLKVKFQSITDRLPAEFPPDSDTEIYTRCFYRKISTPLTEAAIKLENKDYDGAENDYNTAAAVWTHWALLRPEWTARLKESKEIKTTIEGIDKDAREWKEEYPQSEILPIKKYVDTSLANLWEDATAVETTPVTTRKELQIRVKRMVLFKECYDDIQKITLSDQPDSKDDCIKKLREILLKYNFDDEDHIVTEWLNVFKEKWRACEDKIRETKGISRQFPSPILLEFISRHTQQNVPEKPKSDKTLSGWQKFCQWVGNLWHGFWDWLWGIIPVSPSQKIWLYEMLHSVFLPALVLVIMGFSQLYGSNLTFGAKGIEDYFTLVLWGFAAGTASEPIAQLIKDKTPAP